MTLRFTNLREPVSVDELGPTQRKQLRVAGKLYDGNDLPADQRFATSLPADADDEQIESCFGGYLELWDVFDDQQHRFDAFLYAVDSGTVFRRNSTEVVAEMIQFGFQSHGEAALAEQLQTAHRVAEKAVQVARKAAEKLRKAGKKKVSKTSARTADKPPSSAGKASTTKKNTKAATTKKSTKAAAGKTSATTKTTKAATGKTAPSKKIARAASGKTSTKKIAKAASKVATGKTVATKATARTTKPATSGKTAAKKSAAARPRGAR